MAHVVYILRSKTHGTFYIGSTSDLSKRLESHNSGGNQFTRGRRPWEIAYVEEHASAAECRQREREIKRRKSRRYIEQLLSAKRFDATQAVA
jgi:putative endonuclease